MIIRLFFEFFKTGLFAIGGGLATLPFLTEIGIKTGLYSVEDLMNMLAVSESTPGPIGVNMATYVGVKTMGVIGGIITTMGLVLPSIIVIILISMIMDKFKDNPVVDYIFSGLRPASMGLICMSALEVIKNSLIHYDLYQGNLLEIFNFKGIIFAIILYIGITKTKLHPIAFVAISAVAGIIIGF